MADALQHTHDDGKKKLLQSLNLNGEDENDSLKKNLMQVGRWLSHHRAFIKKGRNRNSFFGARPENTNAYKAAEKHLKAARKALKITDEEWSNTPESLIK